MGLSIKISTEEQENSFYVSDCTGRYSSENRGGFGIQNYRIEDVTESFLYVQGPSDTEIYPWKIDVTGSLPNLEGIAYEVVPVQIGKTEIESGTYKIKLVVFVKDRFGKVSEKTGYEICVFVNNIACCIDANTPLIDSFLSTDPKQQLMVDLGIMLEGVKKQIEKGFFQQANQTIDYMKQQCKCSGC